MEDFERYGDDNRLDDESADQEKKTKTRIFRIVIGVLLAVFIGFFAFRMILFDYYPKAMKVPTMTETFGAAVANGEKIYTQEIRFPYDDNDLDTLNSNDLGSFFTDYLYVCPDESTLQITLRINESAFDRVGEKYGKEIEKRDDLSAFSFRLTDDNDNEYSNVTYRKEDAFWMYRYVKLEFSDVPLTEEKTPAWLRVEIFVEGEETPYSYALIYETGDNARDFKEVKVK